MDTSIQAAMMGLVEGLTEFLPISSTGHLILAGKLMGFEDSVGKEVGDTFKVFIQVGAILAVILAYPGRFAGLLRLRQATGFSGLRGIGLLVLTTLPAVIIGAPGNALIKRHLFNPTTVAIGLAAGAIWILLVERFLPRTRKEGLDVLGWREALAVGLFQCLAMWPGTSRAAATILGGMMVGVDRKTATEYSFFAAVPVLVAAAAYDLYKCRSYLEPAHVSLFGIGLVVSFISAWLAVKFFIRFLTRHTLVPFGWYRLAVAAAVAAVVLWLRW